MYMTYTTSRVKKAMLRVFMRLQGNIIGFEMPLYITHTLQMSVIVNIISFEMLM